jgi:putative acetyltransferase
VLNGWFGLGPISVASELQRRGIGTAMMLKGLARLDALGATGCASIGNPYIYEKVGFRSDSLLTYKGLESSSVQAIAFTGSRPKGEL